MEAGDPTVEALRADLAAMRNQRNELRGTVRRLEAELDEARGTVAALEVLVAKTDADWRRVYIRQVETAESTQVEPPA